MCSQKDHISSVFVTFLSLADGCLHKLLLADAGAGIVCVCGGWNRLRKGVRTVCIPPARPAVRLLISGNVIIFEYFIIETKYMDQWKLVSVSVL